MLPPKKKKKKERKKKEKTKKGRKCLIEQSMTSAKDSLKIKKKKKVQRIPAVGLLDKNRSSS